MNQQIDDRVSPALLTDYAAEHPHVRERVEKLEREWAAISNEFRGVQLEKMWDEGWFCWRVRVAGLGETLVLESGASRYEISLETAGSDPFAGTDRYAVRRVHKRTVELLATHVHALELQFGETHVRVMDVPELHGRAGAPSERVSIAAHRVAWMSAPPPKRKRDAHDQPHAATRRKLE